MNASDHLREKGILAKDKDHFIIKFPSGKEFDLCGLIDEFIHKKHQAKEKNRVIKTQNEFHIKEKKCLKCSEDIIYIGEAFESYGWCQHFQCTKCDALHTYSPNDMGQGSETLTHVKFLIDHVPYKKQK